MPLITLLTDFGTADGYVGEMKGVIHATCQEARVVDIAHDVAPQDVEGARLALARYWRRFPVGTVHLVVVDPGVGSARLPIAVASEERFLVGPDNGVLSPALLMHGARTVSLHVSGQASATFHGRDVFAPAAARLAMGHPLQELGVPHDAPTIRRTPEVVRGEDGSSVGEVIAVDRFGNLITNLVAPHGGTVELAGRAIPVARTYTDAPSGTLVALVGSSGLVEVAVRDGSAARALGVGRGGRAVLRR